MIKFSNFNMINESSLSKLYKKYGDCDSGTISACRAYMTYKQRKLATMKLNLIRLGYSVTSISGTFKENYKMPNERLVRERSFVIFDQFKTGNLQNDLKRLGSKYDQDSITYCNASNGKYILIGTNKTGYPGYNKEVVLGNQCLVKTGNYIQKYIIVHLCLKN